MATKRKALVVDEDAKEANLKRLRRIEGQVRGLQRMVEEERYCAEVLDQIASVQEALRSVSRELIRHHLKHCATQVMRKGTPADAAAMVDELVGLVQRQGG